MRIKKDSLRRDLEKAFPMAHHLNKAHNPGFVKLVDNVTDKIRVLAQKDFKVLRRDFQEKGGILIDIREDHEWAEGHIKGAIHLGRGILERDIENFVKIEDGTPLVLYCGGGYRSALAAYSLMQMGYQEVYSLSGGYREWVESGEEVVK